jgi:hypothetical protein
MKIGNLGNQGKQNINGNVSNHCNLGRHVNGGGGGGGNNNNNNNNNIKSHQCIWYVRVHTRCLYFCLVLTTCEFGLQILVKIPNTKFHKNLSSVSTMTPRG